MGFVEGCWVKSRGVDGLWVVALAICMGCWVLRHSSHGFCVLWHSNSGCGVLVELLGHGVDGSQVVALAICMGRSIFFVWLLGFVVREQWLLGFV